MKAKSNTTNPCASKKTNLRGRPRIQGALRENNGRISRTKYSADELAIKIRAQKFNLNLAQAKNPRSQSWAGRLSFLGAQIGLSEPQYKAAEHYLKLYNDYRKAILSPAAHYDGQSGNSYIRSEEEYTQWAIKATHKFEEANKAIEEAQLKYSSENLFAAMQYGILENLELPHLLGSLRIVLNVLHHHFFPLLQSFQPLQCDGHHSITGDSTPRNNISLGGNKSAKFKLVLKRDYSLAPL